MVAYNTSDDNFCVTSLIVDGTVTAGVYQGLGNYQTISGAITAAVSGQTIFIRPGTYTENPALKAGVNLTAFGSDSSLNGTGTVIINGNCTLSTAGTVTISGIQLQTNSVALLTVSGSAASIVNLNNCYLNCSNTTGISFTTANTLSTIQLNNCGGNLGTTGIGFHSSSSTGSISYSNSNFGNSGGSTTISNNSAGNVFYSFCTFSSPIGCTSTGVVSCYCTSVNSSVQNAIALTTNGSGSSTVEKSTFLSGNTSCVSVGTGATLSYIQCNSGNSSSGTAAITGAGTILTYLPAYSGASFLNNVTTQTSGGTLQGLRSGNSPNAGFLGEQIRSTATSAALTSGVAANITSISLTPGIWDISALGQCQPSVTATAINLAISTNSASFTGVAFGDSGIQFGPPACVLVSSSIPSYRVVVTTTTTYFLVVSISFSGTATATGRISATRVG